MTATMFELRFEVSGMTPEIEDDLYTGHDVLVSQHDDVTFVTVDGEGGDCFSAALTQIGRLSDLGLRVIRLVEDLVTVSEIVERSGFTRQAVGNWVRGDRRADHPFPTPYNYVPDRVWLWGEVVDWLRAEGTNQDSGAIYPTRSDHVRVNWELRCNSPKGATWTRLTSTPADGPASLWRRAYEAPVEAMRLQEWITELASR